jgi:hypothetical protein
MLIAFQVSITQRQGIWLSPYRAGLEGIISVVINFSKGATILKIYA